MASTTPDPISGVSTTATDETGRVSTESIRSSDNQLYRVGGIAAILGVAIQIVRQASDRFHPLSEPGNPAVAFADYAAQNTGYSRTCSNSLDLLLSLVLWWCYPGDCEPDVPPDGQ